MMASETGHNHRATDQRKAHPSLVQRKYGLSPSGNSSNFVASAAGRNRAPRAVLSPSTNLGNTLAANTVPTSSCSHWKTSCTKVGYSLNHTFGNMLAAKTVPADSFVHMCSIPSNCDSQSAHHNANWCHAPSFDLVSITALQRKRWGATIGHEYMNAHAGK